VGTKREHPRARDLQRGSHKIGIKPDIKPCVKVRERISILWRDFLFRNKSGGRGEYPDDMPKTSL
jgi:hypothetical protein